MSKTVQLIFKIGYILLILGVLLVIVLGNLK